MRILSRIPDEADNYRSLICKMHVIVSPTLHMYKARDSASELDLCLNRNNHKTPAKMAADYEYGVKLDCGGVIIHGEGANIKQPFEDIPVVMHELSPGNMADGSGFCSFGGQLGFIEFNTDVRLPRHVHIGPNKTAQPDATPRLLAERILVLSGFAMVEMCGELYVIPPKTLVHIPSGVPHTWTACPKGVDINAAVGIVSQKELASDGTFLMVYEYEDPTSFRPTKQIKVLKDVDEYKEASEDELEAIMIPSLTSSEVHEKCWFVWNREVKKSERNNINDDRRLSNV